ncbi:putative Polynucleotide 5'-hydroxyl-kinase GRC3 [Seiridium cardinale]
MTPTKRRKLDTPEQPPAQSAFARLRKLRSHVGASTPPIEAEISSREGQTVPSAQEVNDVQIATPKRPKRGRAVQTKPITQDIPPIHDDARPAVSGSTTPGAVPGDPETPVESTIDQQTSIVQFSSFKPNKSNIKKKAGGKLQLKLSEGERLVILGSYGIHVISGHVTICGAVLRSSSKTRWVHAPHCHALPVIRCPEQAVIELEPCLAAQGLRRLGTLSPLFRRLWNESSAPRGAAGDSSFSILYTSADGPKRVLLSDLKSPPEWNREIETLVTTARTKSLSVVVAGPKSAGKSTFGRLLANQLLTDTSDKKQSSGVAVLDLDPGQPEHGPPGQISLVHITEPVLSPSFCRPLLESSSGSAGPIIRSHTLASVSPASDPELYLSGVADLITHYRNRLGSLPLIINTSGWIQGTGLDLLTSLIQTAKPTNVIYMATGPVDVIDALQGSFRAGKVTKLPSQATQNTSRTAAQLRTMQTMSYFHGTVTASTQGWGAEPLSAVPPWHVQYSGPTPGILGIMCYDFQAPSNIVADAINGTILAIAEVENPLAISSYMLKNTDPTSIDVDSMEQDEPASLPSENVRDGLTTSTPEGLPIIQSGVTLDPKYSQTIGLALLRGIDTDDRVLQILSPISEARINQINERGGQIVLVSGKFDQPSWAYTEDLYRQSSTTNGDDTDEQMDILGEDEAIDSEHEPTSTDLESASMPTPWIEVLHGNQKRGTASRVWRVRRDLGKTNSTK